MAPTAWARPISTPSSARRGAAASRRSRRTARQGQDHRLVPGADGVRAAGPTLGARSIVAAPADRRMKDRLNAIKDREEFRPVAPAVLEECVGDWFAPAGPSPFMLF